MGKPRIFLCRRGSHPVLAHPFHSTTQEGNFTDSLLSLWKESFREPSRLWVGDPSNKVQEKLRKRGHQPLVKSAAIYDGKFIAGGEESSRWQQQAKGIYHKVQKKAMEEEQEVFIFGEGSKGSRNKFQEGTCRPAFFVTLLKACAEQKDLHRGSRIHAYISTKGLLKKNTFVASALVNMYTKCGALEEAHKVFDELSVRNVVSWNVLMGGYGQHGHAKRVLICFQQMQQECLFPNAVTYVYILKACGSIGAPNKGKEVHAQIMRAASLEKDAFVGAALVDMYAKCGLLGEAQEAFDQLLVRDVVSWNALITGYAYNGNGEEALHCFEQMQREGLSPNTITFVCILKACGSTRAAYKGQEVHTDILREGLLAKDNVVGNALIDMYAKCGILAKSQEVFDGLLVRDIISWSALVTGYALHLRGEEALKYLERMQQEGFSPNGVTFLSILKACGSIGASGKGQEIHAKIVGLLRKDIRVANAVVDMYVKCGALSKAQEVFDELPVRSVVLWTTLIAGYAQAGKDDIVFNMFGRMIGEGKDPDLVTFTSVLNSCSNRGLLDEGQMCFETLSTCHGMIPNLEHYICIVDLFGRAGHLDKAVSLINGMPFSADLAMWHTLLGACQKWENVMFGRWAFEHVMQLNEQDVSAYVFMNNIYAAAGRQVDAVNSDAMRAEKQAWKKLG